MAGRMKFIYTVLCSLAMISSCKKPNSNSQSATKDLYTSAGEQKDNYFRYWIEGDWKEGANNKAVVWRAGCPDKLSLTTTACTIKNESMKAADFSIGLSKFLLTFFIPELKTSLELVRTGLKPVKEKDENGAQTKEYSDYLASIDQMEKAIKYANSIAANATAFVKDVIASPTQFIHQADVKNEVLDQYRVPEFYLAKVFQAAGMTGPKVAKPDEIRLYDWTHLGGTISPIWSGEISSRGGGSYRCWSEGKPSDSNQPTYKNASKSTCCTLDPKSAWTMSKSMYSLRVEKRGECNANSPCLSLHFNVLFGEALKDTPELVCNFAEHGADFATIGDLKSVFGKSLGQIGVTR